MAYSVKQLADLAHVSRRTLHYYDEIGLLEPQQTGPNGYRFYGEAALYQLQQILYFKELGFSLDEIKRILIHPGFDLLSALQKHRQGLYTRRERLEQLILTIERTIMNLKGELPMTENELFTGFDPQVQQAYEQEALERWGETASVSIRKWNAYGKEKQAAILAEGNLIYRDMIAAMAEGPQSQPAQSAIARWYKHLSHFYEPTVEIMLGLANTYTDDPRFKATFDRMHPDLATFMQKAIQIYCQRFKTG